MQHNPQDSKTFPDYLCTLARDEGEVCEEGDDLGGKGGARFHFDQGAGMCRKFAYEGCGGNRNRHVDFLIPTAIRAANRRYARLVPCETENGKT